MAENQVALALWQAVQPAQQVFDLGRQLNRQISESEKTGKLQHAARVRAGETLEGLSDRASLAQQERLCILAQAFLLCQRGRRGSNPRSSA